MNNHTPVVRMMRLIDKAKLRAAVPKGKLPAFSYQDGTKHVVLPNGQQVNVQRKDRSISGKAARRERIKARHAAMKEPTT